MEKIILIHYLNVGNMGMADCAVYKDNYMRALPKEDSVVNYIIPIRGETRVECVNPRLMNPEEYAEAAAALQKCQATVNALVEKFKGK